MHRILMGAISATTHEFLRESVPGDGSCLYTAFRYVNGIMELMDNKRLRSMVADYIRNHKNLHSSVLASGTHCKTVEEYCDKIEKGNLRGGEPEIRALAMLSHVVIRLVSKTKKVQGTYSINIFNYGEDNESFKECVYILYDEENKHYDPLYLINKQNSGEKLTRFERNDETIGEFLGQFIQEELHDYTVMPLNFLGPSYETELQTETNLLNETEQIFDLITPNADRNFPVKRKLPGHAGPSFATTTEEDLSPWISNKNDDFDKPTKFTKFGCESMTVEQYLQMDFFADNCSTPMSQQSTVHPPLALNQKQEMRFEVEPALEFRGRRPGDFRPLKGQNRKGEPSKPRPPRYFADRNKRHYLNLLIPKTYLSADLLQTYFEICLVTREINGHTYINPYFAFQTHPTDPQAPYLNPIKKFLDNTTELKAHPDQSLQQLKLQLVVVMHKNPELMKTKQPLTIFSSSKNNNNGPAITETYASHRELKDAYHLHDLRFAITLWKKQPGEEVFRRSGDIQYISQISTEKGIYVPSKK